MTEREAILTLQCFFRMQIAKNKVVEKLGEGKLYYFTYAEFWETLSDKKIWTDLESITRATVKFKCSGAVYSGDWQGGFRQGSGTMTWPDGAIYEGQWRDNHACGQGKFVHSNGDSYEGIWRRSKANGKGVYRTVIGGGTYSGQWSDDYQEGYGIEKWSDGSSFHGFFHKGQKHGVGTQIWGNGSLYKG